MSMIQVEHLTFAYPASYDNLFEDVSFQIDTNWKLGLIGRNGRGKTTLLRLLLGQYDYQGTIHAPVSFDYFPFPVAHRDRWTEEVLAEHCPQAQSWQFVRELAQLDLDAEVLSRPFSSLSQGEQTKVLLAALFLRPDAFLLIDEPTDHLDRRAREVVARYLARKKGFLLVCHDRHFLDGCTDHILALNRTGVQVQSGTFSTWLTNFQRQQTFEQRQNQRLQKDIAQLTQAARRTAAWSDRIEAGKYGSGPVDRGFVGHKSAKMMKRATAIAQRRQRAAEEKAGLLKNQERAEPLKLSPLPPLTDPLLSLTNVFPLAQGRPVCQPVSFALSPGERIALDGGNGSGKSSLLRLLQGEDLPHQGTVKLASGLVISYVPQDTDWLSGSLADFARTNALDLSLFQAILRKMDFARTQFEKDLADFSAGQKKKVLLARSLCQRAHVYVWDEPLNYIDLYSRMQLEQLLLTFAPTMVFAEHDSAFRTAVATRTLALTGPADGLQFSPHRGTLGGLARKDDLPHARQT